MKFLSQQDYSTLGDVKDECPDAVEIIGVEGGWMVFQSKDEANQWRNQQ